jgi:hypothetical protein
VTTALIHTNIRRVSRGANVRVEPAASERLATELDGVKRGLSQRLRCTLVQTPRKHLHAHAFIRRQVLIIPNARVNTIKRLNAQKLIRIVWRAATENVRTDRAHPFVF